MATCLNTPTGKCPRTAPCFGACEMRATLAPSLPVQHYTAPMSDERVRLIVREELVRAGLLVRPVCD